ncbi:MAG: methyltransferase type 11, partial [Pseudolabrys sp.]|nr:methyltransferase type 11 [Pseudolabrys sp.]
MSKTLVQEQFGKTAASYLTSAPHAKGKSLERLVELVQPQKTWRMLDVATGGGHVAYTFSPHVARVWATDITDEMLSMVRGEADKRSLAN